MKLAIKLIHEAGHQAAPWSWLSSWPSSCSMKPSSRGINLAIKLFHGAGYQAGL
jgi:hypothetical protein